MARTLNIARGSLLAGIATLCAYSPAFAQATPEETDQATASAATGGDIIVTANRRAETVLRTPISMAALDTESLIKSQIKGVEDIATIVPGITFDDRGAMPTGNSISVRGIVNQSGDPTTGIYLDEASIVATQLGSSPFGNPLPAVFDLQRVEVLRGPQGTLFGAGAMGGALRFITNKPNLDEVSGRAVGEIGFIQNGGVSYEAGVAVGAPIVEGKLGVRASVWNRWQGGFIDRFDPLVGEVVDNDVDRRKTFVGSFAATWAPIDTVRITPSIFYQKYNVNHGNVYHELVSDLEERDYQNASSFETPFRDKFYVPALTIEADLGFADLVSSSSLLRREAFGVGDLTLSFGPRLEIVYQIPGGYGNPVHPALPLLESDLAWQYQSQNRKSFSQEVRLTSATSDSPLSWTVGGFYSKATQTERVWWPVEDPGTPPIFGGYAYDSLAKVRQEQLSGFAQVDLELFDGFKITAGGRLSNIKVGLEQANLLTPDVPPNTQNGSATPFTPKLGLEWQIDPDNMFYASAGKGFRGGGVNLALARVPGCVAPDIPFYGPDSLWSYEVGTKNRLFGDVLTLAASAYHIDWTDMQTGISYQSCGGGPTVNAGSAEIEGFDAAITLRPFAGLTADFSVAYIDAKFTETIIDETGTSVIIEGYPISSGTAPWSLTAALEYTFPIADYEAYIRGETSYKSKNPGPYMFDEPTGSSYNPDLAPSPGYNILNLRAGIDFDMVNVSVFMTNALNANPVLGRGNVVQGSDFWSASTLLPRTTGVNVNVNF